MRRRNNVGRPRALLFLVGDDPGRVPMPVRDYLTCFSREEVLRISVERTPNIVGVSRFIESQRDLWVDMFREMCETSRVRVIMVARIFNFDAGDQDVDAGRADVISAIRYLSETFGEKAVLAGVVTRPDGSLDLASSQRLDRHQGKAAVAA